jgi:hypothetical protein
MLSGEMKPPCFPVPSPISALALPSLPSAGWRPFSIPPSFSANGAPGEVTNAALAAEIAGVVAGSSANSNGVGTLDTPFADPDAEALRGKLNELIEALRRP